MGTLQDLRYSLRTLLRAPAFSLITIGVLALATGASTAIFSVVHSVVLRPLPYKDPEQLVVALHDGTKPVSPADFLDYQKSAGSFEQMAAAQYWRANLSAWDRVETLNGLQVSPNMMRLLGVDPILGRSFRSEDTSSKALLISHALWQRRFGGDRGVLGRQVSLDQTTYTIIGVMPPSFRFAPFWATQAEMWTPLDLAGRVADRGGRSLRIFARLAPGASVARAQSEMDSIARRLAELYPATNAKLGISIVPLREKVVGQVRTTLLVLFGTVLFVFLIACANVANLALARALARGRETALRIAIGGSRLRLVRMAFVEMLCLAAVGGIIGVLIAVTAVEGLSAVLPPGSLPRQSELAVGPMAFAFAAAMSLGAAVLAAIVPATQAGRASLAAALKEGGRGLSVASGRGTRSILVAAEVAMAVVLLAGAGLMIRTMIRLASVDAGFDPNRVITLEVSLAGTDLNRDGRREPAFRQVRQSLATIAGAESVSGINHLPIGGDMWTIDYRIEGRPAPAPGEGLAAVYRVAMPDYFRTMRIPITAGRDFTERDDQTAPAVAIVNHALARRRWPGDSAVGKRIYFGLTPDERAIPLTIVGVVRDVRQSDWTAEPDDEIYLPYYQRPDARGLSYLTFVIRTRNALSPAVAAGAIGRDLPVSEVRMMTDVIAHRLWRPRLATALLAVFAAIALLLAAVGIYGVVSYSVRRRTQEIGIRMALGAVSSAVFVQVFREGMRPVIVGGCAGLAAALALTRVMRTLLYGVSATDPYTFAAVVLVLFAVAALANFLPAFRATRVDPLTALRHE